MTAYRQGYLERPDRREKFPANVNMELLHTLRPAEGIEFLKHFYAQHQGKFELAIDEEMSDARPSLRGQETAEQSPQKIARG